MIKKRIKYYLLLLVILSFNSLQAQDNIDFNIKLISGTEIQFSELIAKKVTLVNFWALWCKPCRIEMKALKELHEKYRNNGFEILGINQDTPRSSAKVESYINVQNIDYKIALDPNKEYFELFNGQVVPLTLLYDKSGKVIYKNTGYLPGDEFKLEEIIKKILEDNN